MTVCKGNDDCPVTVQNEMQATEVHFEDSGVSQAKDADLVNTISCAAFSADGRQLSEGVKFDHFVETSQWKTREAHIVYMRKKKRTSCTLRENVEQEGTRAPNTNCQCAGLSYVNSQEPEDLSKALLFVDEYISVNAVDSSLMANDNVKDRSPPVSSAKGVQSLVRWAELRDKAEEAGIFEWDQSQETVGKSYCLGNRGQLSFPVNKYGKVFVRRSADLKDVISKKHGKPDIFCNERAGSVNNNQKLKDLTRSHAKLAVYDFETAGETQKGNEKKAREHSDADLDLQGNGARPIVQLESDAVHKESDSEHNFDVGIDTQIAAEAIQELSLGAPVGSSDKDADQCPQSVGGTEKKNDPGVWPSLKEAQFTPRGIASQPIDNRKSLWSDNKRKGVQMLELEGRKNGEKLTRKCLDERSCFEDSGKAYLIKKTKMKRAKGDNINGFKENLSSFVTNEDLPLCELKHRTKQRDIYPLAASLKLANLLNMNDGLMNESMEGMIDQMNVGFHDKKIETSANDYMLEVSAQVENHSELFWEKSRNNGNVYASKGDKIYPIIYEPAINTSDGKLHQLEFDLHDKGKERDIGANMLGVSSLTGNFSKSPSSKFKNARRFKMTHDNKSFVLAPKSWFLSDSSKGKRTCTRMLYPSEGSSGVDYSSVKFRTERCDHSSLRSQFNSESLLNSTFFGSNVKRRRRSSVYISPCWYSSEKNHNVNCHSDSVDVSRQNQISDGASVVETQRISALMDNGISVKLEEASKDLARTMDGARRMDDLGLAYKTVKSHALNHDMSPNYPPLTEETNLINKIDGCHEQAVKKKATLSPLARELVRLGLSESIPEFISKDSRKRKTMANIQVLLSQNLDKGTLKQQKKVSVPFCC